MSTRLAELTTLRLGGDADAVVCAESSDQLIEIVRNSDADEAELLLVGGGSNLVVGDEGWSGTVVLIRSRGIEVRADGDRVLVSVAAGESWDGLVALSVTEGWSGLAAMSGIPGLVGATPVQNVGAYGCEVADVISAMLVFDRHSGLVENWPATRCRFGFRTSAMKHTDRYVVIEVTFSLSRSPDAVPIRYLELARRLGVEAGDRASSVAVRDTVIELRRSKGMVLEASDFDTWSVGSFFVNPFVAPGRAPVGCPQWEVDGQVKLSAAWLIEQAGFHRGYGLDVPPGTVALSTKHALALTNRGSATTSELLALARVIRDGVEAEFGVRLRPEARLAGCAL